MYGLIFRQKIKIKMGGLDSNKGSGTPNMSGGERQQSTLRESRENPNVNARASLGGDVGGLLDKPIKADYFKKIEDEFRALGIDLKIEEYKALYSNVVKGVNKLSIDTIYNQFKPFFSMAAGSKKALNELHKKGKNLSDILHSYITGQNEHAEKAMSELLDYVEYRIAMSDTERIIVERFEKEFAENSRGLRNPKNRPYFEWRISLLYAKREIALSYVGKKKATAEVKSIIEKIFACDNSVEIKNLCGELKMPEPGSVKAIEVAESKMRIWMTNREISGEINANPYLKYAYEKLENTGEVSEGENKEAIAQRYAIESDQLIEESNSLAMKMQKEGDFFGEVLGKYSNISKVPAKERNKIGQRLMAYISMLNHHAEIQSKLLSIGLTLDVMKARPQRKEGDSEKRSWEELMKDFREEAQNSNEESKMVAEFLEIKEYEVPDVDRLSVSAAAIGMVQKEGVEMEKKYGGIMNAVLGHYETLGLVLADFDSAQSDPNWAEKNATKLTRIFNQGAEAYDKIIPEVKIARNKFESMRGDLFLELSKVQNADNEMFRLHPQLRVLYLMALKNAMETIDTVLKNDNSPISLQQLKRLEDAKKEFNEMEDKYHAQTLKDIAVFSVSTIAAVTGGIIGAKIVSKLIQVSANFLLPAEVLSGSATGVRVVSAVSKLLVPAGMSGGGVVGSRVGMELTNVAGLSDFKREDIWNTNQMRKDFYWGYAMSLGTVLAASTVMKGLKIASVSKSAVGSRVASRALGATEKLGKIFSPIEMKIKNPKDLFSAFGAEVAKESSEETMEQWAEKTHPVLGVLAQLVNAADGISTHFAMAGVDTKKVGISVDGSNFVYNAKTPAEFIANLKSQFAGKKNSSFDSKINTDGSVELSFYGPTLHQSIASVTIHPSTQTSADVATASQNVANEKIQIQSVLDGVRYVATEAGIDPAVAAEIETKLLQDTKKHNESWSRLSEVARDDFAAVSEDLIAIEEQKFRNREISIDQFRAFVKKHNELVASTIQKIRENISKNPNANIEDVYNNFIKGSGLSRSEANQMFVFAEYAIKMKSLGGAYGKIFNNEKLKDPEFKKQILYKLFGKFIPNFSSKHPSDAFLGDVRLSFMKGVLVVGFSNKADLEGFVLHCKGVALNPSQSGLGVPVIAVVMGENVDSVINHEVQHFEKQGHNFAEPGVVEFANYAREFQSGKISFVKDGKIDDVAIDAYLAVVDAEVCTRIKDEALAFFLTQNISAAEYTLVYLLKDGGAYDYISNNFEQNAAFLIGNIGVENIEKEYGSVDAFKQFLLGKFSKIRDRERDDIEINIRKMYEIRDAMAKKMHEEEADSLYEDASIRASEYIRDYLMLKPFEKWNFHLDILQEGMNTDVVVGPAIKVERTKTPVESWVSIKFTMHKLKKNEPKVHLLLNQPRVKEIYGNDLAKFQGFLEVARTGNDYKVALLRDVSDAYKNNTKTFRKFVDLLVGLPGDLNQYSPLSTVISAYKSQINDRVFQDTIDAINAGKIYSYDIGLLFRAQKAFEKSPDIYEAFRKKLNERDQNSISNEMDTLLGFQELYDNDIERFRLIEESIQGLDHNQLSKLRDARSVYGKNIEMFKNFVLLVKKYSNTGVVEEVIKAKEVYENNPEIFNEFTKVILKYWNYTEAISMIRIFVDIKSFYGDDIDTFREFASLAEIGNKSHNKILALVAAKEVYGENIEMFRAFAKIASEEEGDSMLKILVAAKDIYGDDLGKLLSLKEYLSNTLKTESLGFGDRGANMIEIAEALVAAKSAYGNSLEKLKGFIEVSMEEHKSGGFDNPRSIVRARNTYAVEALATAQALYGDNMEMFEKVKTEILDLNKSVGKYAVRAFGLLMPLCGNDFSMFLKAKAEIVELFTSHPHFSNPTISSSILTVLTATKSLYANNFEIFLKIKKTIIENEGKRDVNGYSPVTLLADGVSVYEDSLEKFEIFAEISIESRAKTKTDGLINNRDLYGNDIVKFKELCKIFADMQEIDLYIIPGIIKAKSLYGNDIVKFKELYEIFADVARTEGGLTLNIIFALAVAIGINSGINGTQEHLTYNHSVFEIMKNYSFLTNQSHTDFILDYLLFKHASKEKYSEEEMVRAYIKSKLFDSNLNKEISTIYPAVIKIFPSFDIANGVTKDNWQFILFAYSAIDQDYAGNPQIRDSIKQVMDSSKNVILEHLVALRNRVLAEGKESLASHEIAMLNSIKNEGLLGYKTIESTSNFIVSFVTDIVQDNGKSVREKAQSLFDKFAKRDRTNQAKNINYTNADFTSFYEKFDTLKVDQGLLLSVMGIFDNLQIDRENYSLMQSNIMQGIVSLITVANLNIETHMPLIQSMLAQLATEISKTNDVAQQRIILKEYDSKITQMLGDLFKTEMGLKNLPPISAEIMEHIAPLITYLSNIHDLNEGKRSLLSFFILLNVLGKWDSFKRGENVDVSKYFSETDVAKINTYLSQRTEYDVFSGMDPSFFSKLNESTEAMMIGESGGIIDTLGGVARNMDGLVDPDNFNEMEQRLLVIVQKFGSKQVGKALSERFRNPNYSDEVIEAFGPIDNEKSTLPEMQKIARILGSLLKFQKSIESADLEAQIHKLEDILKPSNEVIAIFKKIDIDMESNSGAKPISEDIEYLESALNKKQNELSNEEHDAAKKYLDEVKKITMDLFATKDTISKEFFALHESSTKTEVMSGRFKSRLDTFRKLLMIEASDKKITLRSTMTGNLTDVIAHIRQCLGCRSKEVNNDTNLTFGDRNRFLIITREFKMNQSQSLSDELVTVLETKDADGTEGLSFVMDNVYGTRSPDILVANVLTVLKKLKALKKANPSLSMDIFVTDAALSSCGLTLQYLQEKILKEFGKVSLNQTKKSVTVSPSASGDGYYEIGVLFFGRVGTTIDATGKIKGRTGEVGGIAISL
ncbi:hypothetical protein M0P48_01735 [Candidatus Gracilibacteria bacterium]|nr:hypothetical protein [Candidatus Gracilibacteria bacterium]